MDGVFHGAQLQAGHVPGGLDRAAVIGDMAEPLLAPSQGDHALILEPGQDFLPDGTVQRGAGMVEIAKQEGNVKDARLGHEIRQHAR